MKKSSHNIVIAKLTPHFENNAHFMVFEHSGNHNEVTLDGIFSEDTQDINTTDFTGWAFTYEEMKKLYQKLSKHRPYEEFNFSTINERYFQHFDEFIGLVEPLSKKDYFKIISD